MASSSGTQTRERGHSCPQSTLALALDLSLHSPPVGKGRLNQTSERGHSYPQKNKRPAMFPPRGAHESRITRHPSLSRLEPLWPVARPLHELVRSLDVCHLHRLGIPLHRLL